MTNNRTRPVALVTGASRGLGKAIAIRLAREGYDLSLAARSETALRDLKQDLIDEGARVLVNSVDLTDCEDREHLVAATESAFGRVDLLVNNAAVSSMIRYAETDWDDVSYQLNLNLEAPMHLSHLVLAGMKDRGEGKIVNVSSVAAAMKLTGLVSYGTTKSALEYFTRSLRAELEGTGVTVSVLTAGGISGTGMTKSMEARAGQEFGGLMAKGMMTPEQMAARVVKVVRSGKKEEIAAKGGAMLKAFPGIGQKIIGSSFAPMIDAVGEYDATHGRKISDPTTEELVA